LLVGEALASSQKLANSVASTARIAVVHGAYPGQRGTGGNFAMGVGGKLQIEMGPCAEFCISHLIPLSIGEEGANRIDGSTTIKGKSESTLPLFSWKMSAIGKGDLTVVASKEAAPSSSATALDLPTSSRKEDPNPPPTGFNTESHIPKNAHGHRAHNPLQELRPLRNNP
jgi:hypothetical protein